MSFIRIKQLDDRVATSGLFMGGGSERRKLEPGEIVEVSDDEMLPNDGGSLLQLLWDGGKIDILPATAIPTRPLDYVDRREAKLCSPTLNAKGPDDIEASSKARAEVDARLFEQSETSQISESPVKDKPADKVEVSAPVTEQSGQSPPPRTRRRAAQASA